MDSKTIDWSWVFEMYPHTCRKIYNWLDVSDEISSQHNFDYFIDKLYRHSIDKYPEILFGFFDSFMIIHIKPYMDVTIEELEDTVFIKRYESFVQTDYKAIKCFDHDNRQEAVRSTILNAFDIINDINNENPFNMSDGE